MTFRVPTLFKTAVEFLREKVLMPTAMSSAELRAVAGSVKRRAIFSARVTQARVLQKLKDVVDAMLGGTANLAEGRLELEQVLDETGYTPEGGFPADEPGTTPAAQEGSLRDLRSEERKRLQIETTYRVAANEAYYNAGLSDEARFQYPAWELVRISGRLVPRGKKLAKAGLVDDPGKDWPSRWVAAGGVLYDRGTRMIARKDAPVWQALGDGAGGFKDTLGNPFPPFAFGSGYGIRQIPREECLMLGVIDEEEEIAKAKAEGKLEAEPQLVDDETLAWFEDLKRRRARGDQGAKLTPSERLARLGRSPSEVISVGAANTRARLRLMLDLIDERKAA